MKKLLFLLILIPFLSFSQSFEDALEFLKINEPEWACNKLVEGTFKNRLEISTNKSNSKLILKVLYKSPPSFPPNKNRAYHFTVTEIELSKINMIEAENNSKSCAGIKIITEKNGISSYFITEGGEIFTTKDEVNDFYQKTGWLNSDIRIKNDFSFKEKSSRIIKAIKFMAIQNGAEIKESYF